MTSTTPFGDEPRQPELGGPRPGAPAAPGYQAGSYPPSAANPPTDGYAPAGAGGGPGWTGGEELGSGASSGSGAGGRRALVPWIIGLVVVLVLGGSAVAVRAALNGDSAGPSDALPSDALIFARLDVDPTADQKIQALRLASRFPTFGDATGITDEDTDLRSSLFDAIKGDAPGLADLDYARDVAPWLGSQAGVAVMAPEGDDPAPTVALAVEVTDREAAEAGIAKLLAGAGDGASASAGYAFSGSYAVFAATQEQAEGYAAAADEDSLSSNEEFQGDMDALGEQGIASAWVSADAYEALGEVARSMGGAMTGTDLGVAAPPQIPFQTGSSAYAVRFDERYVEIAMVGSGSEFTATGSDSASPIAGLPESTLFAMSVANGGQYVEQAMEQMAAAAEQTGVNFQREIRRFEQETGLAVPDDFVTLLGDHFTIAVDSDLGSLESPADLRVGALLDTDPAAAQAIIDKLVAAAGGGVQLATVESDGMLAVGPNEAYAGELTGGSLGDSGAFDQAVAYGADSDMAFYFNVDALEDIDEVTSGIDAETLSNISVLQAVGASVQFTGEGDSRGSLRITVDE